MSKTPMMKQYDEAKKACGDALLFFRMGDFYELFHDDAKVAAEVLGLNLTSRDKSNSVPMAGFPYHQLDTYLGKLIKRGFRVAVCDQVEDPKTAKGLVKREVQQIVSPGTVTDQSLLDPSVSNYLVALNVDLPAKNKKRTTPASESKTGDEFDRQFGVAWADISTGRFYVTSVAQRQLADLLARLHASEVLIPDGFEFAELLPEVMVTRRPDWCFGGKTARESLQKQFQVASLDGFGIDSFGDAAIGSAGAVLQYVQENQKASLGHFDQIKAYRQSDFVEIDAATWRSLEISRTIRSGDRNGSLFGTIDRSQTPMGSRLLGEWLSNPLTSLESINDRHDAVEELSGQQSIRTGLRDHLKQVYDLQRLVSRVATGRPTPRDLISISRTLKLIPSIKQDLGQRTSRWLQELIANLDSCDDLCNELVAALNDPAPATIKDGGYIRDGYDAKLDELRKLGAGGKQWIANYQRQICEETGIPSLKVGFNKVFGYYLEVTHTHRDKIPEDFIRKQTLKNAERFITPELKEYEEKVLTADSQAESVELRLFEQLRELVKSQTARLKSNAEIIASLDVIAGLAQLASEQSYARPVMEHDTVTLIEEGRHPVLDIVEPLGAFIPNDTAIDQTNGQLHLITGPNMAGKSTYIRQVALISLLAQIGSFVPAKSATLGVVDKIFARVGASDELSRGQSTFMVEMTETARILNTATPQSLVILDEIGRGTSTYDGVSLAWAIVEFLHDQIGCRTLFATHYHELTELEKDFEGVANFNVAVREWEEKIVFLHKIVPGSADKSYGIHVARLAGVPQWVNRRAEQILENLESQGDLEANQEALQKTSRSSSSNSQIQMTLFGPVDHPLVDKIKALDANTLTPLNALQMLHEWQNELSEEDTVSDQDDSVNAVSNNSK
ncbi:MAG: DNA mismatch repair protein MutS [Planctomycetota bacterium]